MERSEKERAPRLKVADMCRKKEPQMLLCAAPAVESDACDRLLSTHKGPSDLPNAAVHTGVQLIGCFDL